MLRIQIFGIRTPQRYSVRRQVVAAAADIQQVDPMFQIEIIEVCRMQEILKTTPILTWPVLVIEGKTVCAGRIPKKEEVKAWLLEWVDSM